MKDLQLYQQILGLTEPWRVESVKLNVAAKEVEVRVRCAETLWARVSGMDSEVGYQHGLYLRQGFVEGDFGEDLIAQGPDELER